MGYRHLSIIAALTVFIALGPGVPQAHAEPAYWQELVAKGELHRFFTKNDPPIYIQSAPKSNIPPDSYGVEAIFVMRWPGSHDRIEYLRALSAFSTLKGLEYYSESRGHMRLLFEESHLVPSLDQTDTVLPDPVPSTLPYTFTGYLYQKDLSFGENVHEVTINADDQSLSMRIQNKDVMWYGPVPALPPDGLVMSLEIVPLDGYLLVYGYASVDTIRLPGLRKKATASFFNRLRALQGWFLDSVR